MPFVFRNNRGDINSRCYSRSAIVDSRSDSR
nr:MAG TPA: hypothetical protein [Bacteriophage sp.]